VAGLRLLGNTGIKAAIEAAQLGKAHELGVTRDKVLKELAAIGFSRISTRFSRRARIPAAGFLLRGR